MSDNTTPTPEAPPQTQTEAPPQFAAPTRNFAEPAPPPAPKTTRDDATEDDFDELADLIGRRLVVTVRGRTASNYDELKMILAAQRPDYVAPEPLGTPTLIHGGLIEGIHVALTDLSDQIKAQGDQTDAQSDLILGHADELGGQGEKIAQLEKALSSLVETVAGLTETVTALQGTVAALQAAGVKEAGVKAAKTPAKTTSQTDGSAPATDSAALEPAVQPTDPASAVQSAAS